MQTITQLLSLVERQQAELLAEGKAAAGWRAQVEQLERRIEDLRVELERARRPWWRKLFG